MRPQRHGTGTLMLLVAVAALSASLVAQHYRAAGREYRLRADLYRLTPNPHRGGTGKMAVAGDRLVIAFHPAIFRREPGARYSWRFELVDPTSGAVVLSRRDDQEVEVPAGLEFSPNYLEVIGRPPPGKYRGRFLMAFYDPKDGAAGGWSEGPVYEDDLVVPPRGVGEPQPGDGRATP